MKKHITNNRVFLTRLEDAVAKILSVKMAMGLVQSVGDEEEPQV